jgi:PAS domain-containing protein
MPQQDIELILMRQLASCLATPVFLVDPEGSLVFFNEHAERILGRRFEETGAMPLQLWSTMFVPLDEDEKPLSPQDLPLVRALKEMRPGHKRFWIRGLDGIMRQIETTAFPLVGQNQELLGGVAHFWEVKA